MDYKDYYGILGISREADSDEIKRAYRKMARIYHPDVNPDKVTATERFKDINEAYTVLSDQDKRRRYDQINTSYEQMRRSSTRTSSTTGQTRARTTSSSYSYTTSSSYSSAAGSSAKRSADADSSRAGAANGSAGASSGRSTGGPRRTNTGTISEEDMERIFRGFGWAYSAARGQRTASSGADFSDFFDAIFGGMWGRSEEDANSTEFRPGRDLQTEATLTLEEAFSGAYRVVSLNDGRKVEISIPPGVSTGSKLRVRDQGSRSFGRPRGHLYVNITVKPHPQLAREGDDLRVNVTVPYQVAAKSGEVKVSAPDRTVVLKIPAGTQNGQVFRLKGLGMPRLTPDKLRGDLLVEVTVLPAPPPKSDGPRSSARRSTRNSQSIGARIGGWLRNLTGLALVIIGLTAFVAVALSSGIAGWQLAAVIGAILIAHGLATRSWLVAPGAVVTGAGIGYALWNGTEVAEVAQYALPLLPLALGWYLLLYRPAT